MRKLLISLFILLNSLHLWAGKSNPVKTYVIYYGQVLKAESFTDFDLIVLESSYSAIIRDLKQKNKTILGYLSMGEVNSSREYFEFIKEAGCLVEKNPNWPEAYLIDIRKPEWSSFVMETLIPSILDSGFDGIFIDTLDSSIDLERRNPVKYKGMKDAAVMLIKQIKQQYPQIKIMLNRAYDIAPTVASNIDYILGESICSSYDFKEKKYLQVSERAYDYEAKLLKKIKESNPKLQIMTLDYCEDNNTRRKDIYQKQLNNGFIPYITTIGLDKVSPGYPAKK